MLNSLIDKHLGSRLAIVGSSPTANSYNGDYDVSIGVNGAALLDKRFTYFLCGDHNSYKRKWFDVDCSDIRIIADLVALYDRRLFPNVRDRVAVPYHKKRSLPKILRPKPPHIVFSYGAFSEFKFIKNNTILLYGGTISCCALQLAWMMGATVIDIYGCSFSNIDSKHYFYDDKHTGTINKTQISTMQLVIDILRTKNIIVNIIGESLLR